MKSELLSFSVPAQCPHQISTGSVGLLHLSKLHDVYSGCLTNFFSYSYLSRESSAALAHGRFSHSKLMVHRYSELWAVALQEVTNPRRCLFLPIFSNRRLNTTLRPFEAAGLRQRERKCGTYTIQNKMKISFSNYVHAQHLNLSRTTKIGNAAVH